MVSQLTRDGVYNALFDGAGAPDFVAQVMCVRRFLSDSSLEGVIGNGSLSDSTARVTAESFDVVLSDGKHKYKFILAPSLNVWAMRGLLIPMSIVHVTKFSHRTLETELPPRTSIIIHAMELLGKESMPLLRSKRKDAEVSWVVPMEEWVPSAGGRRGYMSLVNESFAPEDPR